jgi:hypothetical protein
MFHIVQSFSLGNVNAIRSMLNVVEHWSFGPFLIPLETNAVSIGWDNQIIDIPQGNELVLECTVRECQTQYKSDSATREVLGFIKRKYLPVLN